MAALTNEQFNNTEVDVPRLTTTDFIKQASSAQDFATSGVSASGKYRFCVVADGHGSESKTIDYLRGISWDKMIDMEGFMEKIIADTNELSRRGEGSTLSVARITDHRVISGPHGDCAVEYGKIELFYVGDSSIKVYHDGKNIYRSTDHDRNNRSEVKRISETCNMRGIKRDNIWDVEVVDDTTIKSVPAALFDFGERNCINFTNSLGHEGATKPHFRHDIVAIDHTVDYKVVVGSDGFWGMTHKGDEAMIGSSSTIAQDLVSYADKRWRQCWNHDNTKQIVKNIRFPTSNIDDIAVSACLIESLIL